MYFYQRLRDLRNDAEKTQEDIANLLKISRQHYSLYEKGERELPMHHFITLAKYYDVSIDYLAGLITSPESLRRTPQNAVEQKRSKAEKALLEIERIISELKESAKDETH